MYHDDVDGDYLDPVDRDPSDYDDASNDWWQDDDQEPDDGNESDLEDESEEDAHMWNLSFDLADDDMPDLVWSERWGLAEAESYLEAGLPIW